MNRDRYLAQVDRHIAECKTHITQHNITLALTPPELVDAHLKLDQQVMGALRKTKSASRADVDSDRGLTGPR
jgi:hypothetical protein